MIPEYRSLLSLKPWEKNYRIGNVDAICKSIQAFGFNGVLRVWQDIIIAGNHAYAALWTLYEGCGTDAPPVGIEVRGNEWFVPCLDVSSHLTYRQAESFAVADNRTQELGSNDLSKLLTVLESLDVTEQHIVGYNSMDMTKLLDKCKIVVPKLDDDAVDVHLENSFDVQPGDVWAAGDHVVVCGDARNSDAYLGRTDFDLLMCDPPYGINYVGKTKAKLRVFNDDGDLVVPLHVLKESLLRVKPGGSVYVFATMGPNLVHFMNLLVEHDVLRQVLLWVKSCFVLGHSHYHYQSEAVLYGWRRGAKCTWVSDRSQSNVLMYDKAARNEDHPTIKPVTMVQYLISNSSLRGDVVLDPCLGSGTTLVACQNSGRRCFGIEIAPEYVSVALSRAESMGLQLKKL